ncbi:MAG: hypothetical protein HAW67_02160 [Endozoicomonadaceae bacterium]|nr:hypothetical protein [Endozoicomonadaceae bacterium]
MSYTNASVEITTVSKKSQNKKRPKQLRKLLGDIDQFGSMSVDTSNEYLEHSKEFKDDFTLNSGS